MLRMMMRSNRKTVKDDGHNRSLKPCLDWIRRLTRHAGDLAKGGTFGIGWKLISKRETALVWRAGNQEPWNMGVLVDALVSWRVQEARQTIQEMERSPCRHLRRWGADALLAFKPASGRECAFVLSCPYIIVYYIYISKVICTFKGIDVLFSSVFIYYI